MAACGRPVVASAISPVRGSVEHAAAAAEHAAALRQATAALAMEPLATPQRLRALNQAAALAGGGGGGGGGADAAAASQSMPGLGSGLGLGLPDGSDAQINAIRATHGGRPLSQLELEQFRRLQQVRQAEARRANTPGGGLRPLPVHVVLPQHQKRWVESRSGKWKADSSAGQPPPAPLSGRVSPGRRPPSPGRPAAGAPAPAAAERVVTEADLLQKVQETPPAPAPAQKEREKSWWERMTSEII